MNKLNFNYLKIWAIVSIVLGIAMPILWYHLELPDVAYVILLGIGMVVLGISVLKI